MARTTDADRWTTGPELARALALVIGPDYVALPTRREWQQSPLAEWGTRLIAGLFWHDAKTYADRLRRENFKQDGTLRARPVRLP